MNIDDTVDGRNPAPTWDVRNPVNNGIFTISTGAGFLPSTVFCVEYSVTFPPNPPISVLKPGKDIGGECLIGMTCRFQNMQEGKADSVEGST